MAANSSATRAPRILLLALLLSLSPSVGCARVAVYERGQLARPTMTTKDLAGPAEGHLRAIHEGATGGAFEAGGGCGCN